MEDDKIQKPVEQPAVNGGPAATPVSTPAPVVPNMTSSQAPVSNVTSEKSYTPVLVLGILSLVLALTFFGGIFAIILGIVGIVLGLSYKKGGGTKKAGFIMSIIGLAWGSLEVVAFGILFVIGIKVAPLGTWDCQIMNLNTGETSSSYTATVNIGAGYEISMRSGSDSMMIAGDSWEFELENKTSTGDDRTWFMVDLGPVTRSEIDGVSSSEYVGKDPSNLEISIDTSKSPREATITLVDSLRTFSCVER